MQASSDSLGLPPFKREMLPPENAKAAALQGALKSLVPPKLNEVITFEGDGSIVKKYASSMSCNEANKLNQKAFQVLTNVADHLKNPQIPLTQEAKKTFRFYKQHIIDQGMDRPVKGNDRIIKEESGEKESPSLVAKKEDPKILEKTKLRLADNLLIVADKAKSISDLNETMEAKIKAKADELNGYLKDFETKLADVSNPILSNATTGIDFYRHVLSGAANFSTDADPNLFATAGISQTHLSELNFNPPHETNLILKENEARDRVLGSFKLLVDHANIDPEKGKKILEKLESKLPSAYTGEKQLEEEDKSSKRASRSMLKELGKKTMSQKSFDDHFALFEEKMRNGLKEFFDEIASGDQAERQAARLMFLTDQVFFVAPEQQSMHLYKHSDVNELLDQKGVVNYRAIKRNLKTKVLNFHFADDGHIAARHSIRHDAPKVSLLQTIELTSDPKDPAKWKADQEVTLYARRKESGEFEEFMAEQLFFLYNLIGMPLTVRDIDEV